MQKNRTLVRMVCGAVVTAFMMGAATAAVITPVTVTEAKAVLAPTKDSTVSGAILFTQVEGGVKIVADVIGLTPGDHGFHIHEFGDCSAPDAKSAGEHFNPLHTQHGARDATQHHAGDFGNIIADASGKAHYEWVDPGISLNGPNAIIGHGMIVHANVDDLKTQPSGNAGPRVACGVIGISQTK